MGSKTTENCTSDGDEGTGAAIDKSMSDSYVQLKSEEFLSGFGAGMFNVTVTFPIHKVMFRQMLHDLPVSAAFKQVRREGVTLLYRGVLPPLAQKAISSSIMFGTYHYYSDLLLTKFPEMNTFVAKSAGAALAGINEAVLTPLERLQTVLQDKRYNKILPNTGHAIRHIWRHFGWSEFYRGGSAVVFRNSVTNVIFFASREKVHTILPKPTNIATKYITDFVSGGVLGAFLSSTFYPLNVIKTRMQSRLGGPFESVRQVFIVMYNERGRSLWHIYRGVHLNVIRSLISWGIINASYELIRNLFHRYDESRNFNWKLTGSNH